jgi:hypothetical protein
MNISWLDVEQMIDDTRFVACSNQERSIKSWLNPPDPSVNHNKALQQRQEGTGSWFLRGSVFHSFKAGEIPFLWLYGIPGCGKSILSSSIVEDLTLGSKNKQSMLLYFYFDFGDNQKQTFDSALRSLLWQATNYSFKELEELFVSCSNGRSQPSVDALRQTLHRALHGKDRVRIVLDALDECPIRSHLLLWLACLAKQEIGNLQIITTSRKEYDIEDEFQKWLKKDATVSLEQAHVDRDIGTYVSQRLQTDPDLQRWQGRPKVQCEIEAKLMEKAKGM